MFGKRHSTTIPKVMIAAALLTGSVTASLVLMAGGCGRVDAVVYPCCCPIPDGGIPDAALPYPDDECGKLVPWCTKDSRCKEARND